MFFAFLQGSELLLVFLAIVILFGATRIPQLGDALGKGIRNFRTAISGGDDKDKAQLQEGQSNKDATASDTSSKTTQSS